MTFHGGEFVVGSFRSIRAFKPLRSFLFNTEDDTIIPSNLDWSPRFRALSHHTEYDIGPTYKAECASYGFDEKKIRELFQIPADATLINTTEEVLTDHAPSTHSEITVTIDNHLTGIQQKHKVITRKQAHELWTLKKHKAPQLNCTCGFYSFYSYEEMNALKARYIIGLTFDFVYGVVENTGEVIHCTNGLRSEKMRILAVCNYDGISKMLEKFPLSQFE